MQKIWQQATALFEQARNHQGFRKYGKNTVWLFAEKAVRMVVGFTVGIYVIRQLGPAQYGLLNYAISYVSIFAVIAGLGLDMIVVRELVRESSRRDELLGTSFLLKTGGFLLMLSGVLLGMLWSDNDAQTKFLILIIAAGYLFQSLQVIEFYYQAEVKSRNIAIMQISAFLFCSVLRAYCAWRQTALIYFALIETLFMVLSFSGYVYFYLQNGLNPWKWRWHGATAAYLMRCSWPFALSSIAISIHMQVDQVMLKWLRDSTEVGYYSAVVRLVTLWYFIPVAVGGSIFPAIIKARTVSTTLYFFRLRRFFALMIWSGIIIASIMSFGSFLIVNLLLGPAYKESITMMAIFSWSIVLVFFGSARGRWLTAENRNVELLVCSVIGAVSNVLLNLWLIPNWGGVGSAIASIIGFAISFIVVPLFYRRSKINTALFFGTIFKFWKYCK